MKKSLLFCGVAALAFASCTQSEVLEVNDSRAIGFDAFVDNNTRAVTDLTKTNLEKFYVFGDYDDGASIAFSNTEVNGAADGDYTPVNPAYWITGKTYTFGAYANGKYVEADSDADPAVQEVSAKLSNGEVTFSNGTLTITGYKASDEHDLIAAIAPSVAAPTEGEDKSVELTFKHLLSKIKFTFSTTAVPEAYKIEVTSIEFEAKKTGAKCTFDGTDITWDSNTGSPADYIVPTLADYAITGGKASTQDILVIPQANNNITATIKIKLMDEKTGTQIGEPKTFTANLATATDATAGTTANTWTPGYVYNYTAEINPDEIVNTLKEIKFTVDVDPWKDHNAGNGGDPITPTAPQP